MRVKLIKNKAFKICCFEDGTKQSLYVWGDFVTIMDEFCHFCREKTYQSGVNDQSVVPNHDRAHQRLSSTIPAQL
jgi:hypothetical protein